MSELQNARAPALGAEEASLMAALPRTSGAGAAALGQVMRDVRAQEARQESASVPLPDTTTSPAPAPIAALYGRGGRAALHQVMWR